MAWFSSYECMQIFLTQFFSQITAYTKWYMHTHTHKGAHIHVYIDYFVSNVPPVLYVRHPAHVFGSHDQNSTLRGSHMTNIEHFSFEYVESHDKHSYCTLFHIYCNDSFSGFLQCIRLGWRHEMAVFTLFWWLLSISDNLLTTWFSISLWINPRKNYTATKARRRLQNVK